MFWKRCVGFQFSVMKTCQNFLDQSHQPIRPSACTKLILLGLFRHFPDSRPVVANGCQYFININFHKPWNLRHSNYLFKCRSSSPVTLSSCNSFTINELRSYRCRSFFTILDIFGHLQQICNRILAQRCDTRLASSVIPMIRVFLKNPSSLIGHGWLSKSILSLN